MNKREWCGRERMARYFRLLPSIVCGMIILCTFNACRTSQKAEEVAVQKEKLQSERMYALTLPADGMTDLTARITMDIDYGSRPLSLKGRLRMRYDEVIQVSFTAFGLMEVASLEIRPDVLYIIDRINKKYVKVNYSSEMLSTAGITFSTIQALFWNRLFLTDNNADVRSSFSIYQSGSQQVLQPKAQGFVKHHFYTDEALSRLEQTQMNISFYEALWHYDMFEEVDGYTIPLIHDISLSGGATTVGTHITLSGVSCSDNSWKVSTDLSRYQQINFDELLSLLDALR